MQRASNHGKEIIRKCDGEQTSVRHLLGERVTQLNFQAVNQSLKSKQEHKQIATAGSFSMAVHATKAIKVAASLKIIARGTVTCKEQVRCFQATKLGKAAKFQSSTSGIETPKFGLEVQVASKSNW